MVALFLKEMTGALAPFSYLVSHKCERGPHKVFQKKLPKIKKNGQTFAKIRPILAKRLP